MSVSDPLIKDIKGCTLKLYNESSERKINDSNKVLLEFCQTLEKIFYKGLIESHSIFHGTKKIHPFNWMTSVLATCEDLADFNYKNSLEEVRTCKNTHTALGKFRLLIRHCLVKKCLHYPIQALIESNKTQVFYERNSVIGDEILASILVSVLLQCSKISFDLHLINSSFLDTTWLIPDLVKLELVPCESLGISISFSENKAVIVHIRSNSVASECGEISPGDILVNLNGVEINTSCKGRLNTIFRLSKGRPITLLIIKAFHEESRDVFPPLKNILRNLHIDLVKINGEKLNNSQENRNVLSSKSGYRATYLGCVDVGDKGSVKQIDGAMKRLLATRNIKDEKMVIFEIGEMSLKVSDLETNEIIFKHSYMQISSCGSGHTLPNYVAYIAGNDTCDAASNFTCHVFHLKNAEDACTILQSIGQGFYRTHFAV